MDDKYFQFLQTEYAQISSYHTNVITFRFTVFGFYLAAISIFFSNFNRERAIFSILLSIIIFIMEMRNRTLSKTLEDRAREIEELLFNEKNEQNLHFYHRLESKKEKIGGRFFGIKFNNFAIHKSKEDKKGRQKNIKWFPKYKHIKKAFYVYYLLSHSFAIDLAFILIVGYCLFYIYSTKNIYLFIFTK
jgi:hypothetical protein